MYSIHEWWYVFLEEDLLPNETIKTLPLTLSELESNYKTV